jgi:hypothetical protein
MLVPGEVGCWTDDRPVDVASIVEHCPSTASAADEFDGIRKQAFVFGMSLRRIQ